MLMPFIVVLPATATAPSTLKRTAVVCFPARYATIAGLTWAPHPALLLHLPLPLSLLDPNENLSKRQRRILTLRCSNAKWRCTPISSANTKKNTVSNSPPVVCVVVRLSIAIRVRVVFKNGEIWRITSIMPSNPP